MYTPWQVATSLKNSSTQGVVLLQVMQVRPGLCCQVGLLEPALMGASGSGTLGASPEEGGSAVGAAKCRAQQLVMGAVPSGSVSGGWAQNVLRQQHKGGELLGGSC